MSFCYSWNKLANQGITKRAEFVNQHFPTKGVYTNVSKDTMNCTKLASNQYIYIHVGENMNLRILS